MKRWVLILGGARSGKSRFAQQRASSLGSRVVLVVTGAPGDREMAQRILRHKRERPPSWHVIEEPEALAPVLDRVLNQDQAVLVDCLTLWVSNMLAMERPEERVREQLERVAEAYAKGRASLVMVSNEVGMGLVPSTALGREFCDLLGQVNQWVAARADEVYCLVAGLPLCLKVQGDA